MVNRELLLAYRTRRGLRRIARALFVPMIATALAWGCGAWPSARDIFAETLAAFAILATVLWSFTGSTRVWVDPVASKLTVDVRWNLVRSMQRSVHLADVVDAELAYRRRLVHRHIATDKRIVLRLRDGHLLPLMPTWQVEDDVYHAQAIFTLREALKRQQPLAAPSSVARPQKLWTISGNRIIAG